MEIIFAPRGGKKELEEGFQLAPKFDENGLMPAVTVDHKTGDVLMVAFMNEQALKETIRLGEAVYWSRSRKELWHKGATSGLTQKVVELRIDCDQDAVVLRVEVGGLGGSCHVGYKSCFYRSIPVGSLAGQPMVLNEKEKVFDPAQVYGKKD
jgi:phosphoribosyl-AMP cyclohydrolase